MTSCVVVQGVREHTPPVQELSYPSLLQSKSECCAKKKRNLMKHETQTFTLILQVKIKNKECDYIL